MYLLSLDISTSTTGFSLWRDSELIEAGALETKSAKFKNKFEKMDFVIDGLSNLIKKHKIKLDKVAAEAAFKKFAGGKTTAQTMAALIGFNFCLCYSLSRKFSCDVVMVDVRQARKFCGIIIPKGTKDKKAIVCGIIKEKYPNLSWETKKGGDLKDWTGDMADSIVVGLAAQAGIGLVTD